MDPATASYFIAPLGYFGAYLIPIIYFAVTFRKKFPKKPMLLGLALQTIGILSIWGLAFVLWKTSNHNHGRTPCHCDFLLFFLLLILLNFLSALYYIIAWIISWKRHKQTAASPKSNS